MEKKLTVPTITEKRQEFLLPKSANAFKSELLGAVREIFSIVNRLEMQSAILTDEDLKPYTREFNLNIQEISDELEGCVSSLMAAYASLEKLDVRNTTKFIWDKEPGHE